MFSLGNVLILTGLIFILLGLFFHEFQKISHIPLPLLPGDILVKKEDFTFYFPIATSLILSLVLTLIIKFFR